MRPHPDTDGMSRPLFGSDCRLKRQRDIDAAFKQGVKLVNRRLVAWLSPAASGSSRLGLSVSRKVGGAVKRNRVKRCLREAFRHLAPSLPEALDVMLVARPVDPPMTLAQAREALGQIFSLHQRRRAPSSKSGQARR